MGCENIERIKMNGHMNEEPIQMIASMNIPLAMMIAGANKIKLDDKT